MSFADKYPLPATLRQATTLVNYDAAEIIAKAGINGRRYDLCMLNSAALLIFPEGQKPSNNGKREYYFALCERQGNKVFLCPIEKQKFIPSEIAPLASFDNEQKLSLLGPLIFSELHSLVLTFLISPECVEMLKMTRHTLAKYADEKQNEVTRPYSSGRAAAPDTLDR